MPNTCFVLTRRARLRDLEGFSSGSEGFRRTDMCFWFESWRRCCRIGADHSSLIRDKHFLLLKILQNKNNDRVISILFSKGLDLHFLTLLFRTHFVEISKRAKVAPENMKDLLIFAIILTFVPLPLNFPLEHNHQRKFKNLPQIKFSFELHSNILSSSWNFSGISWW